MYKKYLLVEVFLINTLVSFVFATFFLFCVDIGRSGPIFCSFRDLLLGVRKKALSLCASRSPKARQSWFSDRSNIFGGFLRSSRIYGIARLTYKFWKIQET